MLFLASCLIYELFLSFYPLYIIFAFNRKTHFKRDFCYISSIAALFTLSYFGFSSFSKNIYTGTSIPDYNLSDILKSVYIYSTSNIPGMMILKTKSTISQIMFGNINYEINLNDYFDLIKFEWIVKILLISTILFITMGKSYTIHFSKRQLLILLAISICLIVLPNIPVSLVELHRDNALYRGITVYTGSYFSGYGYALLFFVIILTIMSRKLFVLRYRIFLLSVLIVLFSIISTNVDISNHYVKYAQAGDMRLWQVVDKLLINNYDYVKGNNNHTGTPEQSIAADLGFTCGSSNGKWVLGFDHDVESRNSQGTGDPPDNPLVNFTNADKTADYLPNINGSDTLGIVYNYQNYMRASYHDSSGGNGSQTTSTSTAISTPVASSIVWQYFLLTFDINAGTTKVEEFSTAARTGTPTASYTYTHSKDYDDLDVIVIMGYTGDNASKLYNGKVTNIKVFNNTDNVTTQTQPNLPNGAIFEESDTGKHYMFDGTDTWNEMT